MAENYFVYGEEDFLVNEKIAELCQRFEARESWDTETLESWEDVQDKLSTQAMFCEQRIFIFNYEEVIKTKPDPGRVKGILAEHGNVFIMYLKGKPDKRLQLYKITTSVSKVIEVFAPKGDELRQWLVGKAKSMGATRIDSRTAELLIYLNGTNMRSLENELIKLINYNPEITVESVKLLAYRDIQTSIFDMVDSVTDGNIAKAVRIAEDLYKTGSAEPYLLQMLARQYRLLFRMLHYKQVGHSSAEIQRMLQLHPYAFKKMWRQAANLSSKDCANAIHLISESDHMFKTGQRQGLGLIQPLIVKIAKK